MGYNCKKICLAGFAGGIIALVVGMLSGMLFKVDYTQVHPLVPSECTADCLWKPMTRAWWYQMFVLNIIEWLLYAWMFSLFYKSIPGKKWKRGLNFGFLVWLIGTLPGMAMTYLSMAVPTSIVLSWTIGGLFTTMIPGPVLAVVFDKVK